MFRKLTRSSQAKEEGASAVEYALLASLIAAVIVITVSATGIRVYDLFHDSCREIAGATGATC